ncbi:MAG: acyl-CoA reductase [Flavobacteriaceae bacterium]|nr:acyl-CoA reductase [Flavobacteriaceae bacterium]
MLLENRISAFVELGSFLKQFSRKKIEQNSSVLHNDLFFDVFKQQIKRAKETNGWFTEDAILYTFENLSNLLTKNSLNNWILSYTLNNDQAKTVAIIMAGNIPLVGFHDFLSVLISGNKVLIKQSSNDNRFLPLITKYLEYVEPQFKGLIQFTEERLTEFDATIATGSNNTARYFEAYFGKYPNITRKNRNSIAVLTGNETHEELSKLGEDIFRYFGLGCRSVSKLFVPKNYNFDNLFKAIYDYKDLINYIKYRNNYDYNKAIYLMSEFKLLDNGFLMLKEDTSYASPIATLFYEYYEDLDSLKQKLDIDAEHIQCIVSNVIDNAVQFGQTQQPQLTDYADGVDTLAFLSEL